ncbi:hypothetical protein VSR34_33860 [Paraburkholderia sp. JHI2823]|uniref:hypothetical protein n=1 Tax=Paraburkholderia sp. JHI2823 TaxID=3112960 RepID=UPI003173A33E
MKDLLEAEQNLDRRVTVDARSAAPAHASLGQLRQYAFINPHGHIASRKQARVVFTPVLDAVRSFGLACLAFVLAHIPGEKIENLRSSK